jgi:hypothetical protein
MVSSLVRCEPATFLAYAVAIYESFSMLPLVLPEGEMITPRVLNDSVGSIQCISLVEGFMPAVMCRDAGDCAIVASLAVLPTHFHVIKKQKHFDRFKAPLVEKSSLSHSWPNRLSCCVRVSSGLECVEFIVHPSPLSSKKHPLC